MPVRAIAPWFGAARLTAAEVGRELAGSEWVGVPFAGSMSELAEIKCRSICVSDLHRHVINLARAIAAPVEYFRPWVRLLSDAPFHPDLLRKAQEFCRANEPRNYPEDQDDQHWRPADMDAAYWYFISCWMGRSHKAGTVDEFNGALSMRWNGNGGDSNTRYRSAVSGIVAWRRLMRRCNFHTRDAFEFLDKCNDEDGIAIYVDPPFPGPGEKYRHKFAEADHRRMAAKLATLKHIRVVCRYYEHPLVAQLYPEALGAEPGNGRWTWRRITGGRTQTNAAAPEVLILNGPSLVSANAPGLGGASLF